MLGFCNVKVATTCTVSIKGFVDDQVRNIYTLWSNVHRPHYILMLVFKNTKYLTDFGVCYRQKRFLE